MHEHQCNHLANKRCAPDSNRTERPARRSVCTRNTPYSLVPSCCTVRYPELNYGKPHSDICGAANAAPARYLIIINGFGTFKFRERRCRRRRRRSCRPFVLTRTRNSLTHAHYTTNRIAHPSALRGLPAQHNNRDNQPIHYIFSIQETIYSRCSVQYVIYECIIMMTLK